MNGQNEGERLDKEMYEAERKAREGLPWEEKALARKLASFGRGRPARGMTARFRKVIQDLGAREAREGASVFLARNGEGTGHNAESLLEWLEAW